MLKFFTHPYSPWAKRVQFLLEELALPYEAIMVKIQEKAHLQKEFTDMNIFSRVPVLVDGDFKLSESGAIIRYLIGKHKDQNLYPANLHDRGKVDEMFEFTTFHINKPLLDLAWQCFFAAKFNYPIDQHVIARAEKSLARDFPLFEQWLMGRNFLVTHDCSLADVNVMPFLAMHEKAKWPLENYPNASAWFKRMSTRSSWLRCQ